MKGAVEVGNEHKITPEEWQKKTRGTWFSKFKSLGDFVLACYMRSEKGIDDSRFHKEWDKPELIKVERIWVNPPEEFSVIKCNCHY